MTTATDNGPVSSDATLKALAEAVRAIESACKGVDVIVERDRCSSQIQRERFFSTVQKLGNALTSCIEADATLRSYIAIFGPFDLAFEDQEEAAS